MKRLKVVNLLAGPGAGKSTTMAGLFFEMKCLGMSVELATEWVKEIVYREEFEKLKDQRNIFKEQSSRISSLIGKVEWVVTDSPILISLLYNGEETGVVDEELNDIVINEYNRYDNYNFFINRVKPYSQIGRTQSEEQAKVLDKKMDWLLSDYGIGATKVDGNRYAPVSILNHLGLI